MGISFETAVPLQEVKKPKYDFSEISHEMFVHYLDNLGLTEAEIRDKKIVDIGAGERLFAAYCVDQGINEDVYSVEPNMQHETYQEVDERIPSQIREKLDDRTVCAFVEQLPFADQSFNLVLMNNFPFYETEEDISGSVDHTSIEKTFGEVTRILKDGGEARITPYYGKRFDPGRASWLQKSEAFLQKLIMSGDYEIEKQDISSEENGAGEMEDIQRLIIRRKEHLK